MTFLSDPSEADTGRVTVGIEEKKKSGRCVHERSDLREDKNTLNESRAISGGNILECECE